MMVAFICFVAGLMLGGFVAVCILAAMQINRIGKYEREISRLQQELIEGGTANA